MYCGGSRFAEDVGPWLRGVEYGIRLALPNQPNDIAGFREWLRMTLDVPFNYDWVGIITRIYGTDETATQKFFEQFDLFRNAVTSRGLVAILDDHREYCIRKFGFDTSSSRPESRGPA
jgi:hypothetical protein